MSARPTKRWSLQPLRRFLPAAAGPVVTSKTCLYTMAPDGDFVIDRVPGRPNIVVASPCSGHGFKFAPAIGQALVELAFGGRTGLDLSRFRIGRFHAATFRLRRRPVTSSQDRPRQSRHKRPAAREETPCAA